MLAMSVIEKKGSTMRFQKVATWPLISALPWSCAPQCTTHHTNPCASLHAEPHVKLKHVASGSAV
jgi:hypothetical protein